MPGTDRPGRGLMLSGAVRDEHRLDLVLTAKLEEALRSGKQVHLVAVISFKDLPEPVGIGHGLTVEEGLEASVIEDSLVEIEDDGGLFGSARGQQGFQTVPGQVVGLEATGVVLGRTLGEQDGVEVTLLGILIVATSPGERQGLEHQHGRRESEADGEEESGQPDKRCSEHGRLVGIPERGRSNSSS